MSELTETVDVPLGEEGDVSRLLKEAGVTFEMSSGLVMHRFTISGTPQALSAAQAALSKWSADYVSREAW